MAECRAQEHLGNGLFLRQHGIRQHHRSQGELPDQRQWRQEQGGNACPILRVGELPRHHGPVVARLRQTTSRAGMDNAGKKIHAQSTRPSAEIERPGERRTCEHDPQRRGRGMTDRVPVAVIGTGVIGASWAALFLSRGYDVVAADPAPCAEAALREAVVAHWPSLERLGLEDGASPERLQFAVSIEAAVADCRFVQENGPERLDVKRELFARLDAAAPKDAILATSSSTITVSEFQDACIHHPGRVVLGHPFNPPHLIPLVEVGGGGATTPDSVARAVAFYRACGKHPIVLRKEVRGHVANRLQAALWQEAFSLVQNGVASVADVDAAIAHGPGLRWALLGPFLNLHLSGGPGGIAALFDKPLWQATEAMWRDLGTVSVDAALGAAVAQGVASELAPLDPASLLHDRDRVLTELLQAKTQAGDLP